MKIVLISCVKGKKEPPMKAKDIYKGPLFKNSLCVAYRLQPDRIYILSAKYHLLDLEQVIEPYDLTLKNFTVAEKKTWGVKVICQLQLICNIKEDEIIVLAGKDYVKPISDKITNLNIFLGNRNYGQRTAYLKSICNS